ncbi:helicase-exonuclease AddAB subunit AddA [Amphibacillus sp. Q70]|uniref:helicase-exonuclease AddAB subunit AddA n=1 Tax=Amphibacillus sp. Q70 TaxID=3453416 RepID=UPI003F86187E
MPKWTEAQTQAIYTAGQDTLVAAAAGSGKTAVLVERIIQKVISEDHPINIDQLLVVTFTNAAAQEMRNRVSAALEQALEAKPVSKHLKQQLTLLQQASISTLHSFCLDLVKRYSYLIDIDPGFRIADDIEADLLRQEVIEDLFEDWYGESFEKQDAFFDVIDRFSSDRSDQDVELLILRLYDFAMQNPWSDQWLDQITNQYHLVDSIDEKELAWLNILKQEVSDQLEQSVIDLEQALEMTRASDGPYHYAEALDSDLMLVRELKANLALGWDDLQGAFQNLSFKALSRKKVDCDPNKKDRVKLLRDRSKKRLNDLAKQLFARDLAAHFHDIYALYPTVKQLVILVKDFTSRYQALKKEKGLVDFSDLEHHALTILCDPSSDSNSLQPSSVAEDLRHKYEEVLIDEYQDTNMVQETIIKLVSREAPGNLFMVGDVKQSIYRFRHAEPSLFIDKYKRFSEEDHTGRRIDLAKNFRSREQVLTAVNYIFRQVLDEEVGEISYDQDAELIYGNLSYEEASQSDLETELVIIDRSEQEMTETEDGEEETTLDLAKAEIEARAYAKRIKSWIGVGDSEPRLIFDKDTGISRPAEYRDIVILLRSMTWASTIMEELKKQGIPVYAELTTGYLEAIEIKVMLNLLRIIDNAKQDIPLASVLKSPIVGINEEELAQIRLVNQRVSYYEALQAFLPTVADKSLKAKLSRFLDQLANWRSLARQGSLSDLIWQIYRETGYYDFVAGMPGGRQRQANLRALYDRARGYEQTSFRGLFRFLRMIERMEDRGEDLGAARALGEQEDVVRITTIHKSKGLEYPIVILGAMDKVFNQQDLRQRYLLHKDYGFGSRFIDPEKRIMYPTLLYYGIKQYMKRELWAEEMRVLYVALTRAKEKLVMVGTVNSFAKKQAKWLEAADHSDWILPSAMRLEMATYMDWVGTSLVRHRQGEALRGDQQEVKIPEQIFNDPSQWKITLEHAQDYQFVLEEQQEWVDLKSKIVNGEEIEALDPIQDQLVHDRLSFQYQYVQATNHRAKQSVTEIKRQQEQVDENAATDMIRPFQPQITERPAFMQQEKRLSRAEIGTAMHTVMQHIPFDQQWDMNRLTEYVQQLVVQEILTQQQADVIDIHGIKQFFNSEAFQVISVAKKIEREVPFSVMIPASQVYQNWQNEQEEQLFLQGIIDLLVETDEGWVIVDYKTDQVAKVVDEQEINRLKKRYQIQIKLYKEAIETILQVKIYQTYLYFFDQSLLINL